MTISTLVVEALFAVIFLRVLVVYARRHDPLQRDVMLVFAAVAGLFVLALVRLLGEPPVFVGKLAAAMLLGQPFMTLRLVRRIRAVPELLYWSALIGWLATTTPVILVAGPLPPSAVLAAVAVFVLTSVTAAGFLLAEAGRRAGASRTRLVMAAGATALFGAALVAVGAAAGDTAHADTARAVSRGIALVAAIGYLLAFMPPRWLREVWSTRAAYRLMSHLVHAPADESPERVWQRYTTSVRDATNSDAAVTLVQPPDGELTEVARSGTLPPDGDRPDGDDTDRMFRCANASTKPAADPHLPPLLSAYARAAGASFVTTVPLRLAAGRGVLVLLNRRRNLFTDDDVHLLGEVGAQAATLAQRSSLLVDRDRLTTELTASVHALTAASQAKSEFLASMSHELRTPLNAIIGFSELMQADGPGDAQLTVSAEWVRHINRSGHHLLALINDVLDLSKIEAGRVELRLEQVDLPTAVGDVVATLRPLSDVKRQEITQGVPPIRVCADALRFRQIVTNLLSNAIKFTPVNGRIFIRAQRSGNEVALTVADTGPGISKADQQRVFEEFQQVGDPDKHIAGTGLGLALTRRLVEAHGGRVELQSDLGRGAKFTVYLPDAEIPVREDASGPDQPGEQHGGILLVEDDPAAARLVTTYLETAGYRVTVAENGEQGLAMARRQEPDAILLDVLLPGVDGWEVLRQLKEHERLRHIPVVMVSVVDQSEIAVALGPLDYFVKPIDRQALLAWLVRHGLIPPQGSGQTTVLAVDDDPATLELLRAHLGREGLRVLLADNGLDGLKLARTHRPDLIICDLVMPDLSGFDVIAALHDDPATRAIPVVAISAYRVSEADKERLSGKALRLLAKDGGELDQLTTAVREVIDYPNRLLEPVT